MFAPFPENSFFTDIWTETTGGKHISIKDLFKIYDDVQLVPEQSRYLNLRSFSTTYHIVNKIYSPTAGRHYCDVAVDDSDHLPFIFSELDRPYYPGFLHFGPQGDGHSDNMKAKLLFDDDASAVEQNNSEVHRAVLILENADRHVSYWLAYGPLSYIDGKECVHREGIIAVKGKLQWKENWESIPRQSVWLA
ncbi:hypothetical protein BDV96DRAFT_571340 [Lophiotrema nucula]|uniref:Uncharacterized protein n=1 Tax=Lophiotrema nucula TaxID=690887 RepID=A0A6A5ZBW4_9PLEO|nr:hypothetical protein BDV96DRAFT_571340 [Lophiotrema nucula]